MYTTQQAGEILKLSQAHVRRLLEAGAIEGKRVGHAWIVFSLDYKRKRRPKGYRKQLQHKRKPLTNL